jgi:hypothetical protein
MARTWKQIWLAALIITVLGSGCLLSCLSATQTVAKADAHACCPKKAHDESQPDEASKPGTPTGDRDCHDLTSDIVKAAMQVSAPDVVRMERAFSALPGIVEFGRSTQESIYSSPDLLALHQTLLI